MSGGFEVNENFLEAWNLAKGYEERGHKLFKQSKFLEAAESHKQAASQFMKAIGLLEAEDLETRNRTLGNHYIELANYFQSLATEFFYRGNKTKAFTHFQQAIEDQKNAVEEYEKLVQDDVKRTELNLLKSKLHLLLAYENICIAQVAFMKEEYLKAAENFGTAEIHSNLEAEFVSELGDLNRLKLVKARSYYIKGQIFRSGALSAIQKGDRKEAKQKYQEAAQSFENAASLLPDWDEYKELSEKARKMASAIKV